MRKKAAFLSYLNILFNLLYGIGMTPFIIRCFGQSEYGIYNLCTGMISYLNLLQFGFSTTYLRYYIKFTSEGDKQKAEELNGMFLVVFMSIAGLILVIGVLLVLNANTVFGSKITPGEYRLVRPLLALVITNVALSTVGVPFQALLTAYEEFVFQKVLTLLENIFKTGTLIILLMAGYRSVMIVAVGTLLSVITLLCNLVFVLRRLRIRFRFAHFDMSLFKEMAGFSFFVFLQSVMDMLNWHVDNFLLARFWGSVEIAVYSVGAQFNQVFMMLGSAITNLYVPYANRLVAEKHSDVELSDLLIRLGRIQFMIVSFIFSALVFFGKPFIVNIFAGKGYENAYYVALLLIAPLILPMSMEIWYHIARAEAKHKTSTTVFMLVALLNTLISIPLCRRYAEVGAALGTCIGMFVANNVFQIWYAQHVLHLDMKRWAKNLLRICPALILPCIVGLGIMKWAQIKSLWIFLLWAAVYTLITAESFWLFAMNDTEKNLLRAPLRRLCGKDN